MPWTCEGCARTFADRPALTNHENRCQQSKKRLSEDLDGARGYFRNVRQRRTEAFRSYRPNVNSTLGTTNEVMAETEVVSAVLALVFSGLILL